MTVIATLACAVTSGAMATQDAGTAIELARSTLGRWVEMRRTISKERQDWTVAKELLQNQASLVRSEIEGVREKIAGAQASIGEADQAHADLLSKSEELVSASTTLAGVVAGLEARTKALLPRLPEPLRERVEPLSQRLPHEPSTTKLSLSERLANVVGIVNEANKFQREITLTSEVRELADGRSTEVATMYVGVSQAYFVSANGSISGSGHGAGSAWAWTRDDGAAQDILRALAIQRNEQVAGFVGLPMQVK